jgi:ribosomal protein S18 acetylase RimI-like enzyme
MEPPAIRTLTSEERERAIAVQVMAFSTDPVMRWFYPEASAYLEHFPGFAKAFGGKAFENGTAYTADGFAGAAFWLPVGVENDTEAIAEAIMDSLSAERLESLAPMMEDMERFHTKEPHWYLPMIGVDPAWQGQGIGSALLRHTLALCDAEGVAAYLESSSPKNVPLYQRHGFEVIGEIRHADSPVFYPMLRPAKRA